MDLESRLPTARADTAQASHRIIIRFDVASHRIIIRFDVASHRIIIRFDVASHRIIIRFDVASHRIIIRFDVVIRKVHWRNPKLKSSNSMLVHIYGLNCII